MKIVCSTNMPYAEEAFSTLGDTVLKDGRSITAKDVRDADLLIIRSTTKVDADLLKNSSVRFIGTGTIGIDHMDIPLLEKNGITWCGSPGCNANSVAEYIVSSLLALDNRHELTLAGETIGIIGVGNVGSLVAQKAKALGMNVLLNDPPRQRSAGERAQGTEDAGRKIEAFVELDELLHDSHFVTMHVPLTDNGDFPTRQMANDEFFHKMRPGTIFINSARGAVMNTDALLAAMDEGLVSHAIIDTWENEPKIRKDLLDHVDIGTPHIAGYSFDGKVMGTLMVYKEACRFLGQKPTWSPDALLPEPPVPAINIDVSSMTDEQALWKIVQQVYNVEVDEAALRAKPGNFDQLRRDYYERREFRFTTVKARNASDNLLGKLTSIGFTVPKAVRR